MEVAWQQCWNLIFITSLKNEHVIKLTEPKPGMEIEPRFEDLYIMSVLYRFKSIHLPDKRITEKKNNPQAERILHDDLMLYYTRILFSCFY